MPTKRIFNFQFSIFSLFALLLVTSYLLIVAPVFAADPPTPASKPAPLDSKNYDWKVHNDLTGAGTEHMALCHLAGMSPLGKCLGFETNNNKVVGYLYDRVPGGGAIGGLTSVTLAMYTPPTSTSEYLADVGRGFGVVSPANAQVPGSGSNIVEPVRLLWQVVRNFVYVLFILVFVVVGFMIMFRQKLSPQAVVTVQTALPGLVIGLLLVTFSYFISALIIDISFWGVQIVGEIFKQVPGPSSLGGVLNIFGKDGITNFTNNSNIFELFSSSFRFGENLTDIAGGVIKTVDTGPGLPLAAIIPVVIGAVIGLIMAGPFGLVALGGVGAVTSLVAVPVISLLVPLVLIIALLIQFFRLTFKLIEAYIMILVSTITGPIIILASSLPGRGAVLGIWWKSLLANALMFPVVLMAFLFAGMILAVPPNSWTATPPLFGGLSTELLRVIIAYGIILGTPAIPGMVKKAIGAPDFGEIGNAAMKGAFEGGAVASPFALGLGRAGVKGSYTGLVGAGGVAAPRAGTTINQVRGAKLIESIFGNQKWFKP